MNKTLKSIIMMMLALFALTSSASAAIEIRGTVTNTGFTWTNNNFGAFYFPENDETTTETLTTVVTGGATDTYSGQQITSGNINYTTTKAKVEKSYRAPYYVVGWMGEKWIALGGRTNKIAKLIMEMTHDESKTLTEGSTLALGNGYILKMQSIDARASPRQAWFTLLKDGVSIDEGIVQAKNWYNYTGSVLGDSDVLIFSMYADQIFSGTEMSMLKIKYGWLIDTSSAKEIKVGDKYGIMEVTQADSNNVILQSKSAVSLSKNTESTIMGNIKLKTGNGNHFLYYPKIDIDSDFILTSAIGMNVSTAQTVAATISAQPACNNTTTIKEVIKEVIREVPVEKIVYVTPEPTTIPTPTPASPGLSGLVAIGVIGLLYVIRRYGAK